MTKRAVVVGVNDYTAQWPDGSSNLTWCVNDAQSMYHLLIDAFGFDKSQVFCYTDGKATRDNILKALRCITSQGEAGDVACFYYSGHGARVKATGGQGDSDLFYETIIPASGSWISDWEIAEIANDLQPSTVNFTVLLDSCHSGGMHPTDALSKVRSPIYSEALVETLIGVATATLIPFGLGLPAQLAMQLLKNNVKNLRKSSDPANGMVDLDPDPAKTLIDKTKSTLIAGCQFDELSWEHATLQHGLLTRSLVDLVDRCPYTITYHDLHDELTKRVGDYVTQYIVPSNAGVKQTPQLRGQMNRMEEDFLDAWRDCR